MAKAEQAFTCEIEPSMGLARVVIVDPGPRSGCGARATGAFARDTDREDHSYARRQHGALAAPGAS